MIKRKSLIYLMSPVVPAVCVCFLFVSCSELSVNYMPTAGLNWEVRAVGVAEKLSAVTWTGTQYVAVGGHKVLTSPDGYTWTLRHTYNGGELHDVCCADSQIIAVGDGIILKSSDGVSWNEGEVDQLLTVVTATQSRILAAGSSGNSLVSVDGMIWIPASIKGIPSYALTTVFDSADDFRFFWVGGADFQVLQSTDAYSWTYVFSDNSFVGKNIRGIACEWARMWLLPHYSVWIWMGVGDEGIIVGRNTASAFAETNLTANKLWSVATNGTDWVIVGDNGTLISGTLEGSANLELRNSPTTLDLYDVIWAEKGFLAVGDSGIVLASPARR